MSSQVAMTETPSPGKYHIASQPRAAYIERVNAAIDYIELHLGEELTLEELAAVAHFSPYHFHRVFSIVAGETLGHFISRTRLERAASLLTTQPARSVTEIGAKSGFPNPSSFARAFKARFGMTATDWRSGGHQDHKPGAGHKHRHDDPGFGIDERMPPIPGSLPTWKIRCGGLGPATLTVENLPDLEVAYVRYTGRYQGQVEVFDKLFKRLFAWAEPRGLVKSDSWVLAVYHDNPGITEDGDLRVSVCLDVPPDVAPGGDIGRMKIAGGTAAIGHFVLGALDYSQAWQAMVSWLPESGYEPADRHPFERYFVGRDSAPGKELVDICLPVRPLRIY